MWWQKKFNLLNNGSIVNDFLIKHWSERNWKVQTFTFAPRLVGKVLKWVRFLT
jgi:hypothetical protein